MRFKHFNVIYTYIYYNKSESIPKYNFIFILFSGDGREKQEAFDNEKNTEIVDVLLCSTFCQSQFNLSQQLAQIHPELTMPMFSG